MDFPKISKDDWKDKIEAELRGRKSLNDLNYSIGEELTVNILLQETDRLENTTSQSFPLKPAFGIYFIGKPQNQLILEALKRGASTIYLHNITETHFPGLLKDVELKYINLITDDSQNIPQQIQRDRIKKLSSSGILNLDQALQNGNLIDSIKNLSNQRGVKGIMMNDAIIMNIALMRAMREISDEVGKNDEIVGFINTGNEPLEYQLIRYTTQAMAAISGGCNHILFPVHEDCNVKDISKIIHISNVLTAESRLTRYRDPWRGAYVIEHMTRELKDKIKEGGH